MHAHLLLSCCFSRGHAYVFFCVGSPPGEAALCLEISSRFAAKWISDQWSRWRSRHALLPLPAEHFVRSDEAQKREQQRRSSAPGTSSTTTGAATEFTLPEWSVATPALLLLLARWCVHLRPPSQGRARAFLAGFLEAALTRSWRSLTWFLSTSPGPAHTHSLPVYAADSIAVLVQHGRVCLEALILGCDAFRRAFERFGGRIGIKYVSSDSSSCHASWCTGLGHVSACMLGAHRELLCLHRADCQHEITDALD